MARVHTVGTSGQFDRLFTVFGGVPFWSPSRSVLNQDWCTYVMSVGKTAGLEVLYVAA